MINIKCIKLKLFFAKCILLVSTNLKENPLIYVPFMYIHVNCSLDKLIFDDFLNIYLYLSCNELLMQNTNAPVSIQGQKMFNFCVQFISKCQNVIQIFNCSIYNYAFFKSSQRAVFRYHTTSQLLFLCQLLINLSCESFRSFHFLNSSS